MDIGNKQSENIELNLLLEAVYHKYGYDFRSYSRASLKRRVKKRLSLSGMSNISELQHAILYSDEQFAELLADLSINVTEMFRDPSFYRKLRTRVIPELAKLPFINIWHAGCSTGEEVYSMAILLKEAGLYDKCRIYATDFNQTVVEKAKEGIYPVKDLKDYIQNYRMAGGEASFTDYFTAQYDSALMDRSLKENIVFSDHNLAIDSGFAEMDLIVCRNVLIYFNRDLQNRVCKLFCSSLADRGYLCLGSKESIRFLSCEKVFEDVSKNEKIYRKNIKLHNGICSGERCLVCGDGE